MEERAPQNWCFLSVLWYLIVTMLLLCSYTSDIYRLGYHEVWIRASTLLQNFKELLQLNDFTLDTLYISPYPPICLCGSVLLVPPQ